MKSEKLKKKLSNIETSDLIALIDWIAVNTAVALVSESTGMEEPAARLIVMSVTKSYLIEHPIEHLQRYAQIGKLSSQERIDAILDAPDRHKAKVILDCSN